MSKLEGYTGHVDSCHDCPNEYDGRCTHPAVKDRGHDVDVDGTPDYRVPEWCPLREGNMLIQLRSGV